MHRTLESEANLLGVVCTEAGIMTAAPYRVIDAEHWIFKEPGYETVTCSERRRCTSEFRAEPRVTKPTSGSESSPAGDSTACKRH